VSVDSLNYLHNIDVDQLWAEIISLYDKGEKWWLDEHILEEAQALEYQQVRNASLMYIENQAMEDDLNDIFDITAPFSKWRMMTFKEVTRVIGSDVRTNSYAYRAAKRTLIAWLQSFPQYYIYDEPKHQMRYKMPPVRTKVS
jgi:putative DNA primase/helicase